MLGAILANLPVESGLGISQKRPKKDRAARAPGAKWIKYGDTTPVSEKLTRDLFAKSAKHVSVSWGETDTSKDVASGGTPKKRLQLPVEFGTPTRLAASAVAPGRATTPGRELVLDDDEEALILILASIN